MRGLAKYEPTTCNNVLNGGLMSVVQAYPCIFQDQKQESWSGVAITGFLSTKRPTLKSHSICGKAKWWVASRNCRKSTTCLVALQSRDLDIVRYAFHAWSRHLEYQGAAATPPTAAARWEYSMELPIHGSIWIHLMCFFDICMFTCDFILNCSSNKSKV